VTTKKPLPFAIVDLPFSILLAFRGLTFLPLASVIKAYEIKQNGKWQIYNGKW
jgi:hypothetical protein